ncbi:hypothetical protein JK364_24065 [Streptomyces sp. 110]|uniref:Uncharacterized protein n=1 Tax=Streptomyces endocoffeicus TaxID=2898945 RepID=A0ABS1PUP9_9ACTN|nr:hypothetical protein [Streptomyces endocoffeicus]MBL1115451.1 hypothetical protein [Streptomyces endocoffeicus]
MTEFTGACQLDGKSLRGEEVIEDLFAAHSLAQTVAANPGIGVLRDIDIHGSNGVLVRLAIPPLWLGLCADAASPFLVQIASELDDQYPGTATWQFWNGEQWRALDLPGIPS